MHRPSTPPRTSPIGRPYTAVVDHSAARRAGGEGDSGERNETNVVRSVNPTNMVTYLNDHLAASVAALKLLDRLCRSHGQSPLGVTLAEFAWEIRREQRIVERILFAYDGQPGLVKRAIASIGELVARIKLRPLESGDRDLPLFEALELLSVGFYGRQSLWRTLERLKRDGIFRLGLDFSMHIEGVERQMAVMQNLRLDVASSAFSVAR